MCDLPTTRRPPRAWRRLAPALILLALLPVTFAADVPREEDPANYADIPPPITVRQVVVPTAPARDDPTGDHPAGASWLADSVNDPPDATAITAASAPDGGSLTGFLSSVLGLAALAAMVVLFLRRYGRVPDQAPSPPEPEGPPSTNRFVFAGDSEVTPHTAHHRLPKRSRSKQPDEDDPDLTPRTVRITFVSDERRRRR